jgi:hypothetical protein
VGVLALVGEQATLPGREHDVFGLTTLEVELPSLPDALRFDVVEARDDRGDLVEVVSSLGLQSQGLRLADGARTVDLRLALTPRCRVEWVAGAEEALP